MSSETQESRLNGIMKKYGVESVYYHLKVQLSNSEEQPVRMPGIKVTSKNIFVIIAVYDFYGFKTDAEICCTDQGLIYANIILIGNDNIKKTIEVGDYIVYGEDGATKFDKEAFNKIFVEAPELIEQEQQVATQSSSAQKEDTDAFENLNIEE